VAEYIKSGQCKSIGILAGPGCSAEAKIPDYHNPDLLTPKQRLLLTATQAQQFDMINDPGALLTQTMFMQNPKAYLEFVRPFVLGTKRKLWKATLSHWFMKFLEDESLLTRVYTYNVDGLDFQTGIDQDKVCNLLGTAGRARCESCGDAYPFQEFCSALREGVKDYEGYDESAPTDTSPIACLSCKQVFVKPDTVMIGPTGKSSLPEHFYKLVQTDAPSMDLLIILGSNLPDTPANRILRMVPRSCPRLIITEKQVGRDLGIQCGPGAKRDVFCQMPCDQAVAKLLELLGWTSKAARIRLYLPPTSQALVHAALKQGEEEDDEPFDFR